MGGVLQGDLTAVSYFTGRNPAFAILGDLIAPLRFWPWLALSVSRLFSGRLTAQIQISVPRCISSLHSNS